MYGGSYLFTYSLGYNSISETGRAALWTASHLMSAVIQYVDNLLLIIICTYI